MGLEEAAHRRALVPLLEAQLRDAQAREVYWRTTAERLLDAALLKRNEISRPVFERPEFADPGVLSGIFANMAASELPKHDRPAR
jgi:hypothetical protein